MFLDRSSNVERTNFSPKVASIFSLVERKPNPKISIFAYPTIRRISLCANSQEAIGYLCCTFAGTEYLLAQTTYPDFRLIVWHWSTGERLATIEARNVDLTTIVTLGRGDSRSTSFTVRANEDWTEETWMEAANIRRQSMYEETRLSILNDWNEVKNRVKELLDENEAAPENARLPISAFDLDQEARKRKLAEARSKEELLVKDAEERVARHDRASRYFRETFLDSLTVKPRSIFSLFARSKVTNYPLAKLAPEDTDRLSWCRFSMEMREMVSRLEDEAGENSEDSRSSSSHPGFVEILEACTVAEHRERELKARFNERFEKTRSRKKSEMRAANERVERTRRIVDELASTFGVDARSNLLEDAPRWHPIELLEEEEEEEEEDPIVDVKTEENEEGTETEGDDFHREALQRTMDGVLEPRLEDNAKRNIPVPDCLLRTKCATEEDVRAIESYEKKLRVQEEDRGRYKTMLEAELERIKEEFWKSAKAFDDELHELSAEKMRTVERSILAERLKKVQAILQHRRIVEGKREIQRKVELELVPATKEVRKLSEDCDLFEAAVAELRNRYESVRKGEKLVDGKFRAELADLKTSSTEEHLFRHYRRRPRLLEAGCSTSVAFLAELASCLVEQRYSEILPRECSAYLRRMDELDRMPEGLSSRLEPDHWRAVCRLRRLKLEAETKARSCAIELAEAEQSLTFMRNACSIGRNTANRCKQEIEREEKSLADLSNDREVSLFLKAGQLYMEAKEACPRTDWEHAVFIPREELTRANEAIAEAERRRSVALEKLENIEKTVALEEWRHARVKMTMEDLQEEAKDLELFKVSRIALERCQRSKLEKTSKEEAERVEYARRKVTSTRSNWRK
ncbi:PREDICTED: cilia- and flagella-associated protein 43-like [Habropoda laboriosa]|uniref:cilia- and flagella-associated protein 43-like n=1 Tax=Habropoda laboriosa TaxID=597456 RepID=UPI00083D71C0|nr:PREDICTED: cilia- and flagella-associated protein 43-like [Habropoda laboriosa]